MTTSDSAPVGTVVPVDVVAFCVGTTDAAERSANLYGTTVDYAQLTAQNPEAFLGGSATRGFTDALHPLEAGVHLHWALPDALTRAQANEKVPLAFPAVPNRWLVTRFTIAGGDVTATSFVVESDTLHDTPPSTASLQVPVRGTGIEPAFNYLGQSYPLEAAETARLASVRRFRDATGLELTAVANGLPSFASYYPEGRNSFGFHDTLADVSGAPTLMYVVTGWFDDSANDPAGRRGAADVRPSLVDSHRWAAEDDGDYTLYSGAVHGVSWNAATAYILPPDEQPSIAADLAIANSPSEALAAYFRTLLHPDSVHSEQLLTAFQQGLWPRFTQPTTDALAQIAETLHGQQFGRLDSGLIYSLYVADVDAEQDREAIDLPTPIGIALNTLNGAAADLLQAKNHLESFQWRVFADWYRYFLTPTAQQPLIASHFSQTLYPIWAPLQAALLAAQSANDAALKALQNLLVQRPDLNLRSEPGPRYWQPNPPAVLLKSDTLAMPARYGGDGRYSTDGTLACRNVPGLVASVTIAGKTQTAQDFADVTRLTSNILPYAEDCSALLAEACLLDPDIAAAWSGTDTGTLAAALEALLAGGEQNVWTIGVGTPPSPVAFTDWGGANPWLPIFLTWTAQFTPLPVGSSEPYPATIFTDNFAIDPTTGSFVRFTGGQDGAATAAALPPYSGSTTLSPKPAQNFLGQLDTYLAGTADKTLQAIRDDLAAGSYLVQPLAGFSEALLNRQLGMQFAVMLPSGVQDQMAIRMTKIAQQVLGYGAADPSAPVTYHVGPLFNQPFNPLRAGSFTFALAAVDAYGQSRQITTNSLAIAESMTSPDASGAAYAAPRLAQPARLLFQWLSAASDGVAEYDGHPATSPICGWLLPNHLAGGFFLYDSSGRALGSLFVAGDDASSDTSVVWQSAPGDDADIDQPIEQALAAADPRLAALAKHLKHGPVADFNAFYQAVDTAHGSINPANPATDAGLAVFIGRPVALVQAALRLDLKGRPSLSQNSTCLGTDGWQDSDGGLSGVSFPVVVGDIDRLDDGLIGYYRGTAATGYDLSVFFSEAALPDATGAVVQPTATTLTLSPTPALGEPDPPPVASDSLPLLMLVDPRAPVHAVSGILPTQTVLVPPDLAVSAMTALQFSFPVTPVLRGVGGLALPVPRRAGYDVAFLQQQADGTGGRRWITGPDLAPATAEAISNYTPQMLVEGWLRVNPTLLTAALTNSSGQPLVMAGIAQAMTLTLVNRKPTPVTFSPGVAAPEGTTPHGSILYVHFGTLVAPADVAAITLSAPGWTFTPLQDAVYGAYFAGVATSTVVLQPAGGDNGTASSVAIAVTGLKAATGIVQADVHVDTYAVEGIGDAVATAPVSVTQKS